MINDNDRNPAQVAAETAQQQVFDCINAGESFLVEAGAGAGKTYSLISALKYLIDRRGDDFRRRHQHIACITYTNVATEEIKARTDRHPIIQAETIHSFCWSAIRPFQPALLATLLRLEQWAELLEDTEEVELKAVHYDLGYRAIKSDRALLHHDDVITLAVELLKQRKFQTYLQNKYPVLFIDEYQDTDTRFAQAITDHFIETRSGPLIGFFGDHWQKIYKDGCGKLEHRHLKEIGKKANFRSAPAIVSVLNRLRPDLPQEVTDPTAEGFAAAYHTNDWSGERQKGAHVAEDLHPGDSYAYLEHVQGILSKKGWDFTSDSTKILMLTHRSLATQIGYPDLFSVFTRSESFVKKEDPHISFLVDVIEPACEAYDTGKYGEMFAILGGGHPTITSKEDKVTWKRDLNSLLELRKSGTIGHVMTYLKASRIRIPESVRRREKHLDSTDQEYQEVNAQIRRLYAVPFKQITSLARFIEGNTPFSTKHGVKGAEFENVLVIVGRGWNQYNFNQMLELIGRSIPSSKQQFFDRNRNLFYVCCSRPKKRLAILFTQRLSEASLNTLRGLFGDSEVYPLPNLAL